MSSAAFCAAAARRSFSVSDRFCRTCSSIAARRAASRAMPSASETSALPSAENPARSIRRSVKLWLERSVHSGGVWSAMYASRIRAARIACRAARSRAFSSCWRTSREISESRRSTSVSSVWSSAFAFSTTAERRVTSLVMLASEAVFFASAAVVAFSCDSRSFCWAISALSAFCCAASCAASSFCRARASSSWSARTGETLLKPRPTTRRGATRSAATRARHDVSIRLGAVRATIAASSRSGSQRISLSGGRHPPSPAQQVLDARSRWIHVPPTVPLSGDRPFQQCRDAPTARW